MKTLTKDDLNWNGKDTAWQLSNEGTTLNVDKSDGSAALAEDAIYTETFYPKMATSTPPARSAYYNYPICYVKNSKIKIKLTPSNNYVSHLTGNTTTGTIPTDAPDIYLNVKKKISGTTYSKVKQTSNKITDCASLLVMFTNVVGGDLRICRIINNYKLNPINPIGSNQFASINLL